MTTGYSFVMLERPGGTVFRLEDATATLLREVADHKATRNDVAMGKLAASLLLHALESDVTGPPTEVRLPVELVIRRSCGCP